jgi:hypothetical protein
MNSRQKRVLAAVFAEPASPSLAWMDIEGLLLAVGCRIIEGSGSRVRFEKDGLLLALHRPHPAKEAKRYQVREVRAFLTDIGVHP